jgi:hypothetical protein
MFDFKSLTALKLGPPPNVELQGNRRMGPRAQGIRQNLMEHAAAIVNVVLGPTGREQISRSQYRRCHKHQLQPTAAHLRMNGKEITKDDEENTKRQRRIALRILNRHELKTGMANSV